MQGTGEHVAKLSQAAIELLSDAGATEISDDFVVIGNTDLRILLSQRAVIDLNQQARERDAE